MRKKAVSGIMLTLLLTSMLMLAFNIQPAEAEPTTWTVDDDGGADFTRIQDAINAANVGDTIYVYNGTYHEHVVVDKTVSLVGEDKYTTIIDGNSTGNIMKITTNAVDVTGFTIQKSGTSHPSCGIYISELSTGNNISYNLITNDFHGIMLDGSSSNFIYGNNITNNYNGIYLYHSSSNMPFDNNVANNSNGITLGDQSDQNTVYRNTITNNGLGVYLTGYSANNNVSRNNITENGRGFYIVDCGYNNISENNITENNVGISLWEAKNNKFHHNNFINNTKQASTNVPYAQSYANIWDDGYPSGGNYWNDYTGIDVKSGPDQDQLGSDGLGDTPYVVDGNNQDNYPIMPGHELVVSIMTPTDIRIGRSSPINATVMNSGLNDESAVELLLFINGIVVDSTIVSLLRAGNSYTLSFPWTPTTEGTYNITAHVPPLLEEGNKENNQATEFVNVYVPQPPVASFTYSPTDPIESQTVTFDASASYDPDGTIISYEWDFGDGLADSGEIVTHAYTDAGTYVVALTVTDNEDATDTDTCTLTISATPTYTIGVEAGDWIKCDYTVAGWPSGTSRPEWLKVEILSVEGTTATVKVTLHMSDGTEQSDTVNVNVATGSGTFQGLSGFVIPANSKTGDTIYMSGYGNVTLDGETTKTCAGTSRTVVYASFSQFGTQLTYYWDKETGVMVEASTTSGGMTGTAKATETNMWETAPSPFWAQWWLWAIVAAGIVALVGAVYFLKKRKQPAAPSLSTEEGEPLK